MRHWSASHTRRWARSRRRRDAQSRRQRHRKRRSPRGFVAERLAAFKVPVRVLFWPETLPRNANGKILKSELKKAFV